MLHKMAFQLSGKVIPLHSYNTTAEAYLCNQGGTASLYISRLACFIKNLADKHNISLLPVYIPTHFNVAADYLSWGRLVP